MSEPCALGRAEILERLHAMHAPAVLVHRSPDGDAIGSAVATVRYLRARGIAATLLLPDGLPERLAFLAEDVSLCEGSPREIVSVDVASLAQAGVAASAVAAAECVISIDHHATSTPFAPHYTCADASATGEILYDLFSEGGRLPLPLSLATPLYAAIASDTGGFRFRNAGAAAHRAAAALLEAGVDAADISRRLFELRTDGELAAMAYAATAAVSCFGGRVSVLTVPVTLPATLGCAESDFDAVIDTVRARHGVEIAAVIRAARAGAPLEGAVRRLPQ